MNNPTLRMTNRRPKREKPTPLVTIKNKIDEKPPHANHQPKDCTARRRRLEGDFLIQIIPREKNNPNRAPSASIITSRKVGDREGTNS